jgi:hypothetical protein
MDKYMKIQDLFVKPIERPINGVIKADQRDAESIWQELDEYVVTKQLTDYFRSFFDAYLAAADRPNDPVVSSRMGVWVSGFFGSGKSHFIKILSYLLENGEAENPATGEKKRAAQFFDAGKIRDPLLLADIERAINGTADVLLFNIDSKADSKSDRDVILQVFLRVFNEKLGLSGDAPYVADMERHLISKGAFSTFKEAFEKQNGSSWLQERDAVGFLRDDIVSALSVSLGMSEESAATWFDNARDSYRINIEGFAKLLQEYLDTREPGHRIIFLVDEVGQFIGDNTQLMLTLQTITEQLGTLCKGRAWVIVTSQEDIDKALGEANKAKSQDFSKIQGRFHTRLSLASSNTDEVIGERLLAKTDAAHVELRDIFVEKGDVINNALAFVGNSVTLRGYKDSAEFVTYYPFAPYHFQLLQKIFESIRNVGATGKHLSRGERSLLDAFQSAAKTNAQRDSTSLIPLYDFFPSIESFLDTAVKRSIDQALENQALVQPFDVQLLRALFLVRYIPDVLKPNIDNLATLCLTEIDQDKLALKRSIQESLARLERERLVSRNGDLWFFLTNEERDVAREIGHVEISAAERSRFLADLIFSDVFADQTKVRHRDTKADYEFNRWLDAAPYKQSGNELTLEIISPLNDDYGMLTEAKCILRSSDDNGRAVVRMAECERMDIEITQYLQIEKYIQSPKADSATPSIKQILYSRKEDNRERRKRLTEQLADSILTGDHYAMGQKLNPKAGIASSLLDEMLNYLISNTYNKLGYLKVRQADAIAEIKAVLLANDIGQHDMALNGEEGNPQAITEVRQYLQLVASQTRVLLSDVVDRFSKIPYGWKPEWEIVLLVTRLYMSGEIKLMLEGDDLDPRHAVDALTKSVRFKQVSILKRRTTEAASLNRARDLHRELFNKVAREEEDPLAADFRSHLQESLQELNRYAQLASKKHHPGKAVFDDAIGRINRQLAIRDTFEFLSALIEKREDWRDLFEDIHDVTSFYKTQLQVWERMLVALEQFSNNRDGLDKDAAAAAALRELEAIRDNASPYGLVGKIEGLLATVQAVNERLASELREKTLLVIEACLQEVEAELAHVQANAELRNKALYPLQQLKLQVAGESRIPHIRYAADQAREKQDEAIAQIVLATRPAVKPVTPVPSGQTGTEKPVPEVREPKPVYVVRASESASKSYLESEAEVEAYITALKSELLAAIKAGKRVRIQ